MDMQKTHLLEKLIRYLQESFEELKKVSWPSRSETFRQTTIVVVASVITALFLGLLDFLLQFGISQFVIS